MNLPNKLTVLRLIFTVMFAFFMYAQGLAAKFYALLAFTCASLTDWLDGYYARKLNLITRFGKIMDPIADKILMLTAFYIFMQMHIIAFWMFGLIAVREVLVTGLRLAAIPRGAALAAEKAGKVKTVLQIVAVYLIMIFIVLVQLGGNAEWYTNMLSWFSQGINVLMFAVVLITLFSGITFCINNRKELFHVR